MDERSDEDQRFEALEGKIAQMLIQQKVFMEELSKQQNEFIEEQSKYIDKVAGHCKELSKLLFQFQCRENEIGETLIRNKKLELSAFKQQFPERKE